MFIKTFTEVNYIVLERKPSYSFVLITELQYFNFPAVKGTNNSFNYRANQNLITSVHSFQNNTYCIHLHKFQQASCLFKKESFWLPPPLLVLILGYFL